MPHHPTVRKRRRTRSNASDSVASIEAAEQADTHSAAAPTSEGAGQRPSTELNNGAASEPALQVESDSSKRRRTDAVDTNGTDTQPSASSPVALAGDHQSNSNSKSSQVSTRTAAILSTAVPLKPRAELSNPSLVQAKRDETPTSGLAGVAAAGTPAGAPSVWDAQDDTSPNHSPAAAAGSAASTAVSNGTSAASSNSTDAGGLAADAAGNAILDSQLRRQQDLLSRQKNAREALADFVAGTVSCHVFHSNFPEPEWHPSLPRGVRLCDPGQGRAALAEGMRAAKQAAHSSLVGLRRRDLVEDLVGGRLLQAGMPALEQRVPTPHLGGFPLPINRAPWATGPVARREVRKAGIGVRAPEKGIGPRWWGIKPLADAPPDTPLELKMGVAGKFLKPLPVQQAALVDTLPASAQYQQQLPGGVHQYQQRQPTQQQQQHGMPPQPYAKYHTAATHSAAPGPSAGGYYAQPQLPQGFAGAGQGYFPPPTHAQALTSGAPTPQSTGSSYAAPAQQVAPAYQQHAQASYAGAPNQGARGVPPTSAAAAAAGPRAAAPAPVPGPVYGKAAGYTGSAAAASSAAPQEAEWRARAAQAAYSSNQAPPASAPRTHDPSPRQYDSHNDRRDSNYRQHGRPVYGQSDHGRDRWTDSRSNERKWDRSWDRERRGRSDERRGGYGDRYRDQRDSYGSRSGRDRPYHERAPRGGGERGGYVGSAAQEGPRASHASPDTRRPDYQQEHQRPRYEAVSAAVQPPAAPQAQGTGGGQGGSHGGAAHAGQAPVPEQQQRGRGNGRRGGQVGRLKIVRGPRGDKGGHRR